MYKCLAEMCSYIDHTFHIYMVECHANVPLGFATSANHRRKDGDNYHTTVFGFPLCLITTVFAMLPNTILAKYSEMPHGKMFFNSACNYK